jgi:hypothetical protein
MDIGWDSQSTTGEFMLENITPHFVHGAFGFQCLTVFYVGIVSSRLLRIFKRADPKTERPSGLSFGMQ